MRKRTSNVYPRIGGTHQKRIAVFRDGNDGRQPDSIRCCQECYSMFVGAITRATSRLANVPCDASPSQTTACLDRTGGRLAAKGGFGLRFSAPALVPATRSDGSSQCATACRKQCRIDVAQALLAASSGTQDRTPGIVVKRPRRRFTSPSSLCSASSRSYSGNRSVQWYGQGSLVVGY